MFPGAQCGQAVCRSGPRRSDSSCWGGGPAARLPHTGSGFAQRGGADCRRKAANNSGRVGQRLRALCVFRSEKGQLQGILIDQWRAWEKQTGIKVEVHAMDWDTQALRRMRAGEFDVIDCIFETAERRNYFDFAPAYARIETAIFFRNDISGITDLASLKGFPVGVKTGDQHIDILEANGVTTVVPFPNNDAIVDAARQHKINVFVVDAPSAVYLLNKLGIDDEFRHTAPIFRDELRRAVRKGEANLLRTVSEGFAAIEPREFSQIHERWFGRTVNGKWVTLPTRPTRRRRRFWLSRA